MVRIVLSGIETNNKGAELMLYAILQEIEQKFPEAEVYLPIFAVRQGLSYVNTNLKLKDKPCSSLKIIARKFHLPGILRRLHLPYLFLDDVFPVKDVKLFIDGSGFAFSDQWKLSNYTLSYWETILRGYHKQGTKIVFLPQAFGPAEHSNTKRAFALLSKYADLIMPREKVSLSHLQKHHVDNSKLYKFTDFTSLVKGIVPEKYAHLKSAICVIPNLRMIDKGIITLEDYVCILMEVIKSSMNKGFIVYLLNHEGIGDERLAYECSKRLDNRIEVVTGLNALEVKGLIASSYMCITSRFHGVASALNSCVPCLATSWSHKYEELFSDYGMENSVLDLKDLNACLSKVNEYLDIGNNQKIREHLVLQVPRIQNETREMWNLIWDKCQI